MSFPRYAEYVDSGVEWLGAIPKHWHSAKVWMYFELGRGRVISNEEIQDFSGEYPVYSSQTKDNGVMGKLNTFDFEGDYITWTTDGANAGTVSRRSGKFNCTNVCGTMKPLQRTMWLDFYAYALSRATSWFVRHDINPKLMNNVVSSIPIPILPFKEQTQIARFLDHETTKIDALIAEQKRLIKLLQEKRQAVISHVVTKGLDPNVPMKDSGVEWLGDVPLGWTVGNLSYSVASIGDVDHCMPPSVDEGIPYVMTGDLSEYASGINFAKCKQVTREEYLKLSKRIKTSEGDVIMARYATIGTATYVDVDKEFLVSYSCVTIKPKLGQLTGLYLYYFIKSDAFLEGVRSHINTNTQGNVGVGDLKKVKVVAPSIAEQIAICEHISKKLESVDAVQRETERSVNLLQERRSALISAAVTGKIDVRDWQPPADESAFDEGVQKAGMEASA